MHDRPFADYPTEKLMREVEATPLPRNLAALLKARAASVPDVTALDFFELGQRLTYRELAERVQRLAFGLTRLGVRHGSHVGLMLPTAPEYPVAWLAVATLGAVTVPINYSYTAREVEHVVTDADVQFLLAHSDYLSVLEERTLPLPKERIALVGGNAPFVAWETLFVENVPASFGREPGLDDLLNIQFTSGTTGLPKGAMMTHRSLLTHARVGSAMVGDVAKNFLIANPFYYITAEWQFLTSMFQSGTAYYPRRQSATRFMEWVREHRIHFCNFPEVASLQPPSADDRKNDLKVMYCYSHQSANYRRHEERYGCLARQGYGMTEVGITTYVPPEADHMTGTGTIGIPAAFREVCILDADGTPVPDGETGEICVRGAGLLLGYYKRGTEGLFHPGGWFRTGDLGRRNAEGWFWYLGRLKDMVKRSGENVSATEVESVLRGVAGVEEAAVVPVPDAIRGEEVKAYLLLADGLTASDVPPQAVYQHCAANLAKFKIPRYIEYRTSFPRTPGLKIQKSVLVKEKPDLTSGSFDFAQDRWV